jgi:hypothetical protein
MEYLSVPPALDAVMPVACVFIKRTRKGFKKHGLEEEEI